MFELRPECDLKSKLKIKNEGIQTTNPDYIVERSNENHRVNIDFTYKGMNNDQVQFALETIDYVEEVYNNPEFKKRWLATKCRSYRHSRTGKLISKETIFKDMMDGDFIGSKIEDNSIDLLYSLYSSSRRRTIGYTTMSNGRIYTNRLFFNRWMRNNDHASLGGHLAHEALHSDGYRHQGAHSTCPIYEWGDLVRIMIREYKNGYNDKGIQEWIILSS